MARDELNIRVTICILPTRMIIGLIKVYDMKNYLGMVLVTGLFSTTALAHEVTIEHQMGKTTLSKVPQRVVVIGNGALDAVDYFGIEPIAVAKASVIPNYLSKYQQAKFVSAGSFFEPDFETIYMQKPDLIIVGPRAATKYKELSEIAPTVVFAVDQQQGYWKSTQQQWRNLGQVFAISDKVEQKIEQLDQQFKALHAYNEQHQSDALTVMSSGGNITAFGSESRFEAIYKDFGFKETVAGLKTGSHGDLVSYEFISKANPSTLLIIDRDKLVNKGESKTAQEFDNALIKSTKAFQDKRMTYLDLDAWYLSIAGVTATEQMIADIKKSVNL